MFSKKKKKVKEALLLSPLFHKRNAVQRSLKVCPRKHNEVMELRLESSDSKDGLW